MGLLQTRTPGRRDELGGHFHECHGRSRLTVPSAGDEPAGRHEPQTLYERILPADPYAAWLERREAEAEREREGRPQIRLVHRLPGGDRPSIVARRL